MSSSLNNRELSEVLEFYKCPQCGSSKWHINDLMIFCVASEECAYRIFKPEFLKNLERGKILVFNPSYRRYILDNSDFEI